MAFHVQPLFPGLFHCNAAILDISSVPYLKLMCQMAVSKRMSPKWNLGFMIPNGQGNAPHPLPSCFESGPEPCVYSISERPLLLFFQTLLPPKNTQRLTRGWVAWVHTSAGGIAYSWQGMWPPLQAELGAASTAPAVSLLSVLQVKPSASQPESLLTCLLCGAHTYLCLAWPGALPVQAAGSSPP